MSDEYEYFNSEEELRAYESAQKGTPHGRKVIESLFPGVKVSSDYRPPSHPLSKKNPNSYHKKSDRAVDIAAIPGMTFEDVVKRIKDEGYDILEKQDEYKNPSKHATGKHWHFVIGDQYEYFNSEEEMLAADAKVGTAPAAPKEPWKPREFDQNAPIKPFTNERAPNEVDLQNEYVVDDERSAAMQDIQKRFSSIRNGKSADETIKSIKKDYGKLFPQMTDEALDYAGKYYLSGGKAPIDFFATKTNKEDNLAAATAAGIDTSQTLSAPPPLEFGEIVDKTAVEMASLAGEGLNAALTRAVMQGMMTEEDAAREMELIKQDRGARAAFWADQANRTKNPIMDELAKVIGGTVGDINPTYLIDPGKTALQRIGSQAAMGGVTDLAAQGIEQQQGLRKDIDPVQVAVNTAASGAFQGLNEGLSKLAGRYRGQGAEITTFDNPKVMEVSDSTAPKAASAPTVKGRTVYGSPKDQKVRTVSEMVAKTTEGWTNSPEIVVYTNVGALAKAEPKIAAAMKSDGAAKAPGFYGEDGRIHIIADNVSPDRVQSLVFHEALGHDGLSKEFGEKLAEQMSMIYDRNWTTRREAGNLAMKGYGEAYASTPKSRAAVKAAMKLTNAGEKRRAIEAAIEADPRMKALLAEEVLAKTSEGGPVTKNILDKVANTIRAYARKMGMKNLDLSAREVKAIIADAHARVISGEGKAAPSGMKYMRVYHGSGADFDKFDNKKINTGEGAQVYGHGMYFTETRSIAQQYKDKIGTAGPYNSPKWLAVQEIDKAQGDVVKAKAAIQKFIKQAEEFNEPSLVADFKEALQIIDKGEAHAGKLYEVDLPDDMKWLAWDFQPTDAEKAALKKLGIEYADNAEVRKLYEDFYTSQQKMLDAEDNIQRLRDEGKQFSKDATEEDKRWGRNHSPEYAKELSSLRDAETSAMFLQSEIDNASPHGEMIYKKLVDKYGSASAASKVLEEAGFDGVKYLDGFSRDYGEGSYNYVVFNDSKPKIVNKYSLPESEEPSNTEKYTALREMFDPLPDDAYTYKGNGYTVALDAVENPDGKGQRLDRMFKLTTEDLSMTGRLSYDWQQGLWKPTLVTSKNGETLEGSARFAGPIRYEAMEALRERLPESDYEGFRDATQNLFPRNKYALSDTELTQKTTDKFMKAMKGARRLTEDRAARVAEDRKTKLKGVGAARASTSGKKGLFAELSALKGETTKSYIEPLGGKFSQRETKALFDAFKNAPNLTWFQSIRARQGLLKLMEGDLPTPSELDLMGRVLGRDFVRYALDLRKTGTKMKDWVQEGVGLQRAMISSMDLSAPFRQGWGLMGRKQFWANLAPMLKQAVSKDFHNQVMLSIEEHPYYDLSQKAGLFIAEMGSDLNAREENYASTLADKIPGVSNSNMAYTGFLNKVRFDTFVDMVDKYKSFEDPNLRMDLTDPENLSVAKQLAKHLTVFTGRGSLGKRFESAASFLSMLFFSPRLMASRINILFNGINPLYWHSLHPVARREVARDYAKMSALTATTIGLIKFAFADDEDVDVELDPRSSDFGKIRIGERRYDILGGLGQYLVLGARLATGETKTGKGEVKELKKGAGQTERDVLIRFLINKAAPIPGYVSTGLEGENPVGEEFEPAKDAAALFVPLFLRDLYKGFEEEGLLGAAAATPALFGFGYSKYATVPSKYDAYGRTYAESKKKDPVVQEMEKLQQEEALPIPLIELATNTNLPKDFREVEDVEVLNTFQEVSGKYIMEGLRELIKTEEWRTMTNEDKIAAVRKVKKDSRKLAREEVFGGAE
jgi:hypothetical protein